MADADDVAADRAVAKLGVERGHAGDARRGDRGLLADPLQGLLGQIAVVPLDGLQDGNHHLRTAAEPVERLVNESHVNVAHLLSVGWVESAGPARVSMRIVVGLADSTHRTLLLSDAEQILLTSNVHPPVLERGAGEAGVAKQRLGDPFAARRAGLQDIDLLVPGFFAALGT